MADFDPDAYLNTTEPPKTESFDPDAYLAGTKHPILSQLGRAVTDIPSEIGNEASAGYKSIKDAKVSKVPFIGPALTPVETTKSLLGAARVAASPITGPLKSVLGHGLTAAEMAAGEYVVNPIVEKLGGTPQHPDPEKMYETSKEDVDKALLAMPAGRTAPKVTPPPVPIQEPFGVTRTAGERTGDIAARQFEQGAIRGEHGPAPQAQAAEFFNAQRPEQLASAKEDVLRQMDPSGGQILAENPVDAAQLAQRTLQGESARTKAQVTAAYDRAKKAGGEIHTDAFVDMPQNIKTDLSNRPDAVIIDDNTPVASRMVDYLDGQIGRLNIQNKAQPQSTGLVAPGPAPKVGVSLEGVDQWRKNLSRMRSDARTAYSTNPSDARASQAVIDAFDARVNQAVNSDQFSGSKAAVDAWNTARDMHSQRMRTWGNDPAGKMLQKIVGSPQEARDPMSLNKVADALLGTQGTSATETNVVLARRVKQIFGEDSPEWAALRQGLIHKLISVAEGNNERGAGTVATRLNEFLHGRGSDMAGIMLTPAQRSMLTEYANLHRSLQVPQVAANWPNTAAGVIPHIKEVGKKILSAVGAMMGDHFGVVGHAVGYGAGRAAGAVSTRAEAARNLARARQQMPLVGQQFNLWQRAVTSAQRKATAATTAKAQMATVNLINVLEKAGVDRSAALRILQAGPDNTNDSTAKEIPTRAEGGVVGDSYSTFLSPGEEAGFQSWKNENSPNDSGVDYDLRGAYKAQMQRDPESGHLGDRFKKPNHPTFSDESQYAVGDQRERAGHWIGEQFVPPVATRAEGGEVEMPESAPIPEGIPRVRMNMEQAGTTKVEEPWQDREARENLALQPQDSPGFIDTAIDAGKRFANYTGGMASDIAGLPKKVYEQAQQWHGSDAARELPRVEQEHQYDPMTGAQITPDVSQEAREDQSQGTISRALGAATGTNFGQAREETWPERMVVSGATLPHDVATGKTPVQSYDPTTGEYHSSPELIERTQDLAGMAGSGGLGAGTTDATLGSAPFLRPALKHGEKIYKGKPGQQHADVIPDELYPEFQKRAMSGDDISDYQFGFMDHKGRFLDREAALDYAIHEGLVDPQAARQGALTSTILEDSGTAGAPLAALERAREQGFNTDKTLYHGTSKDTDFKKFKDSRHGTWTTEDPAEASMYAKDNDSKGYVVDHSARGFAMKPTNTADRVLPLHAKPLENPYVVAEKGFPDKVKNSSNYKKAQSEWFDQLKREGYDGVDMGNGIRVDFNNANLRSKFAEYATKNVGKSGILLEDSSVAGAPLSAMAHTGDSRYFPVERPNGWFAKQGDGPGAVGPFKSKAEADAYIKENGGEGPHVPPFYSDTERALSAFGKDRKLTGQQWANALKNKGAKPEEMDWRGVTKYLEENKDKQISRQDLESHLGENKTEIKTIEKGALSKEELDRAVDEEMETKLDEHAEMWGRPATRHEMQDMRDELEAAIIRNPEDYDAFDSAKYGTYQLPGGKNYRERLLTLGDDSRVKRWKELDKLPVKDEATRAEYIKLSQEIRPEYNSGHWDEPDVLAHRRSTEREVAGKPSLHAEEIQSDWHQEGRKQGYKENVPEHEIQKAKDAETAAYHAVQDHVHSIAVDDVLKNPDGSKARFTRIMDNIYAGDYQHLPEQLQTKDFLATADKLRETSEYRQALHKRTLGVPDAPFKDSWHRLAMNDMLREAAEKGFDRVSWTGGEAQPTNPKNLGRTGEQAEKTERGLVEHYDKKIVNYMNKVGNQYGVKVKEARVKTQEDPYNTPIEQLHPDMAAKTTAKVYYLDITPKMKEDILKKGFSLFSDTTHGGVLHQNDADRNTQKVERPSKQKDATEEVDQHVRNRAAGGRVLASNINHAPTDAQKEAGNYAKDHIYIHGLNITVENAKGSFRSGTDPNGKPWRCELPAHYGYVKGTTGADGDHLDVYMGPYQKSKNVFVVNQINKDTGKFDETKSFIGFLNIKQAVETYQKAFSDGKALERIGSIVPTTIACFKDWVNSSDHHKPFTLLKK